MHFKGPINTIYNRTTDLFQLHDVYTGCCKSELTFIAYKVFSKCLSISYVEKYILHYFDKKVFKRKQIIYLLTINIILNNPVGNSFEPLFKSVYRFYISLHLYSSIILYKYSKYYAICTIQIQKT